MARKKLRPKGVHMGERARQLDIEVTQTRIATVFSYIVPRCTASTYSSGIRASMRLLTDKDTERGTALCLKVSRQVTSGEMAEILSEMSNLMRKGAVATGLDLPADAAGHQVPDGSE